VTGVFLRDIANNLEKIKLCIHPKNQVTTEIIDEFGTNLGDIYNLVDKILSKDYSKAFNCISQMLEKDHFLPSLMFMQTTFSNLLRQKVYSKTMSSYDIALKIGQSDFVVKKNLERIRNVSVDDLIKLRINMELAEYRLKSGIIRNPLLAYEMAFMGE
ncbi:hypothetical protein IJ670_03240, partial [bacterium]|nr:hypothetical protein [bacterium]